MNNLTPPSELPKSPQVKFEIEKTIENQVNFVAGCRSQHEQTKQYMCRRDPQKHTHRKLQCVSRF